MGTHARDCLGTADLLELARGGDHSLLGTLLVGFRDYLLAVAHRELDPRLRAKLGPSDLVQETFLHAQRAFDRFAGTTESELRAWLQQILLNCCRDLHDTCLRTAKRQAGREIALVPNGSSLGLAIVDNLPVDSSTPSGHAIADEEAARLAAAVATLPDDYREVVWLRNWEGLTFDEIGRRTGRSGEAVRKVFYRAVKKLGDVLVEDK